MPYKLKLLKAIIVSLCIPCYLSSCLNPGYEASDEKQESTIDTTELIRNYIFGLWSLSDGNMLNNDGYFFQPDGTIRLVASEYSGQWNLIGRDSLRISFQIYSMNAQVSIYKIDSLAADRMVLSSNEGTEKYRKVPFGINKEGTVLQGYFGTLMTDQKKFHDVDIPTAKEVSIQLSSENPSIVFRFFEKDVQLTSTGVKSWRGILTHGGKYQLQIMDEISKNSNPDRSYSIKVIGY